MITSMFNTKLTDAQKIARSTITKNVFSNTLYMKYDGGLSNFLQLTFTRNSNGKLVLTSARENFKVVNIQSYGDYESFVRENIEMLKAACRKFGVRQMSIGSDTYTFHALSESVKSSDSDILDLFLAALVINAVLR